MISVLSVIAPFFVMAQTTNIIPSVSAPASPERLEQVQIDLGNGFYSREFYDLAIVEYRKYLEWFPAGTAVEEAMYRVADCLREMNKKEAAYEQYLSTQKAFPKGKFFARASFRIGERNWDESRYQEALKKFTEAVENAESLGTRLTARFYQVRVLIQLHQDLEAIPLLQELAQTEKQNPYRGFALLELARLTENSGQESEACILYAQVLNTDVSSALKTEAGAKAGLIEMKSHRWKAATDLFEKVRKLDVSGDWISFVNLNLARAYYQNDQYGSALHLLSDPKNCFPKNSETEQILLQAHSLRQLKKYKEAIRQYDLFLKNNPTHPSAESVAYERLICLLTIQSDSWDSEAVVFLKAYPHAENASRILYLQADQAFQKRNYAKAASLYASIPLTQNHPIDPSLIPEILYRHSGCLMQLTRYDQALPLLNEFLQRFPKHTDFASALFQRGLAEQSLKKNEAATKTFKEFIEHYPKAPERETALYRLALLHGELKQYSAMRSVFQKLTKEYPKTTFSDDASYWTGWSYFEEKKYTECLPHLQQARKANSSEYSSESTSRIILANYHLKQRPALLKEINSLPANDPPLAPEIYDWVAQQSAKEKDHASSEKYFRKLADHPQASEWRQPARWGLAASLAAQSKWKQAIEVWETYQKEYPAPSEIIATKLELSRAYAALKEFVRAQKMAEEILQLQPEGKTNAEARLILGDIMAAQKKHADAAKYYLSVAILYDDPEITPHSLSRAIQSFEAAGDTHQVARLKEELKTKYPKFKTP